MPMRMGKIRIRTIMRMGKIRSRILLAKRILARMVLRRTMKIRKISTIVMKTAPIRVLAVPQAQAALLPEQSLALTPTVRVKSH